MTGNPFHFNRADPMGPVYAAIFYMLLAVTAVLAWVSQPKSDKVLAPEAKKLQWSFLVAWYVCVAGDWLQGPYVYALYAEYGFSRPIISQLFVAGFGASMIFGTFAGSLADRTGRKRSCQAYCVLYILSCVSKHFANYWVLMLGRVTGGIATSLLFSGFESWLACEARERRRLDGDTLGHIFALMWFGNSVVAILAGIFGDVTVGISGLHRVGDSSFYYGGLCSPFDLAIVLLLVGLVLVSVLWEENYGAASSDAGQQSLASQIRVGTVAICGSRQLMIILLMVACFEGSMYSFVFNWTPALSTDFSTPAFGMIFASFMMAYMCGSSCFDLLSDRGVSALPLAQAAFWLGAIGFVITCIGLHQELGVMRLVQVYAGFLIFEFCCGLYFPSVSTIKGQTVPESIRATVYNLYRVPMNAIVLVVLLSDVPMTGVMVICFLLLSTAGAFATFFVPPASASTKGADPEYGAVEGAKKL